MVFISIFMLLLLIGVTLWLWRLGRAEFIHSAVGIYCPTTMRPWMFVDQLSSRLKKVVSFLREWYRKRLGIIELEAPREFFEDPTITGFLILFGRVNLPKKVYYEGDSQNISLLLEREYPNHYLLPLEPLKVEDTAAGKQVTLNIQEKDISELSLEVKLLASEAFGIDGEKIQKKPLSLKTLAYLWNFQFKQAGKHEICLVLNMIDPLGEERYIGRIEQAIKVVKFDHATQRQVQIGAAIAGTVTLLGGIATGFSAILGYLH